MELRHLRYFVAVAETLNFSEAAQRLHIAQPPLSRQIKQLEDELGAPLLIRDRRSVMLTDAGEIFLQEARGILNQSEHAVDAVRRAARGELGKLRVGIGSGLGHAVNRALFEHVKSHPGVEVECQDILSSLQNAALVEREIDVGVFAAADRCGESGVAAFIRRAILCVFAEGASAGAEAKGAFGGAEG